MEFICPWCIADGSAAEKYDGMYIDDDSCEEALFAIKREMERTPNLKVTVPNLVEDDLLKNLF